MLTYKEYKALMESDMNLGVTSMTNLGILGAAIAEAKAKLKKKMIDDEEMPMDDEEVPSEEEPMDDETDETGDGETVEPSSEKDAPMDDEELDDDDEEEAEVEPAPEDRLMMMKKKMKRKMKKEDVEADKVENVQGEEKEWIQSIKDMLSVNPNQRFWDGLPMATEDALLPEIDPETGHVKKQEPGPGEVGFSPNTRIGDL